MEDEHSDPRNNETVKRLHAIAHDPELTDAHLRAVLESIAESVRSTDYGALLIQESDLSFRLGSVVGCLRVAEKLKLLTFEEPLH